MITDLHLCLGVFVIDDLFYVYLAIAAATAIYSFDASQDAAKAQEEAGLNAKKAADMAAQNTERETQEAVRRERINKKRALARARSGIVGTSGMVFEGSLEDAFVETAGRAELEIQDTARAGLMEAANQRSSGALSLWEARTQAVTTRVQATGSLLSSAASIAGGSVKIGGTPSAMGGGSVTGSHSASDRPNLA